MLWESRESDRCHLLEATLGEDLCDAIHSKVFFLFLFLQLLLTLAVEFSNIKVIFYLKGSFDINYLY